LKEKIIEKKAGIHNMLIHKLFVSPQPLSKSVERGIPAVQILIALSLMKRFKIITAGLLSPAFMERAGGEVSGIF